MRIAPNISRNISSSALNSDNISRDISSNEINGENYSYYIQRYIFKFSLNNNNNNNNNNSVRNLLDSTMDILYNDVCKIIVCYCVTS